MIKHSFRAGTFNYVWAKITFNYPGFPNDTFFSCQGEIFLCNLSHKIAQERKKEKKSEFLLMNLLFFLPPFFTVG